MNQELGDFIEASGLMEYDPAAITRIYAGHPNRLLKRLWQTLVPIGLLLLGVAFDWLFQLLKDEQRARARAKECAELLVDLGPAFIKAGQALSTRPDIVPPLLLEELAQLQDQLPGFDSDLAMACIEEDLGAPIDSIYDQLDRDPISAASLGQVHKGILKGGSKVAVKVQRPGLREQITLCDVGDIFTIPANNEKSFDQISKGIAHVFSSGAFPIILGGDHSIGFPTVRGVCRHLGDKKVGIIHFDRHVDTQEIDLDERMHTCPWFHATNMANAPAENLVQLGIGGWQVPREGVKVCRERGTNVLTVTDITEMGLEAAAQYAIERATDGTDCVYISFDIDCIDAGFVPGTGWPEPGGLMPREALKLLELIVRNVPVCGLEIVEVSPPYDISDMTSLMATRVICDTMAHLVVSGQLPRKEKPEWISDTCNMNVDQKWR